MVGRELHTICPLGEDHQGHDRGGRTTGFGSYGNNNNGRGNTMLVWRSSILMTIIRHKVLSWIRVMVKQGFVLMNFCLPA